MLHVTAAVVVLLLSLPSTRLWRAALPVYLAGILKYGERTLSLRSASIGCLMDLLVPPPDAGPSYAKFMEEYASQSKAGLDAQIEMEKEPQPRLPVVSISETLVATSDQEIMSKAYHLFQTFKCLVVDLILTFHDRAESQPFFLQRFPEEAFKLIEVELSFVFDMLYTKTGVGAYLQRSSGMLRLSRL